MHSRIDSSELSVSVFNSIIPDLSKIHTKDIILCGGEPFCHPDIINIIELIKRLKMRCIIPTNGSLISPEILKKIFQLQVDELHLNLWAGSSDTYTKVHPNQTKKMFARIKNLLLAISRYKRETGATAPKIYLVNVIVQQNQYDILNMIKLGQQVKADEIEFQIADLDAKFMRTMALSQKDRTNLINNTAPLINSIKIKNNLRDFIESLQYSSWQKYYAKYIKLPCYIGLLYAQIYPNGDVVPCCGSKLVLGNITKESFSEIWMSDKYARFRADAQKKNLKALDNCSCLNSCSYHKYNILISKFTHPLDHILKKINS
jgi:radical SAM protein with 4Fe4S-binding SPASM domain